MHQVAVLNQILSWAAKMLPNIALVQRKTDPQKLMHKKLALTCLYVQSYSFCLNMRKTNQPFALEKGFKI